MTNTAKVLTVSAHTTVCHNLLLEDDGFTTLVSQDASVEELIEYVEANY
jgi:hypothetical protein